MTMKNCIKHSITLDLDRTGVQHRLAVRRGDSLVHKITVKLTRGGLAVSPADAAWVRVEGTLPDGSAVYADCEREGGAFTFTPGAGFFAESGAVICRMVLRGGAGEELYSPAFALDAEKTPLPGEAVAAEPYSPMANILRQVEAARLSCAESADRAAASLIDVQEYVDTAILGGEW